MSMSENIKILIIDDEIKIINVLKRILQKSNYEVLSTTESNEAITIIDNTKIDMIICDYNMPNLNGIDVLKYSKQTQPDAVRILITGYSDANIAIAAINEGDVYYYISKPWKNDEVIKIIENGLKKKQEKKDQTNLYKYMTDSRNYFDEMADRFESTKNTNTKFSVYDEDDNIILINTNDILYMTSLEGKVHIFTINGSFLSQDSLSIWENKLRKDQFFRSHRSYIVNSEKIEKLTPWFNGTYNLKLVDCDESIPVSRGKVKDLKEMFGI